MEKEVFDRVKIGERVGFVAVPGDFFRDNQGTITAKIEDEWGLHVDVRTDTGRYVSAGRFTTIGIGCYRLEETG